MTGVVLHMPGGKLHVDIWRRERGLMGACAHVWQVVTVQEGDAFVSLYPGETLKISCGLDCPAAPIIGKQWRSWVPDQDEHYRWIIAPARTFYTSLEARTVVPAPSA